MAFIFHSNKNIHETKLQIEYYMLFLLLNLYRGIHMRVLRLSYLPYFMVVTLDLVEFDFIIRSWNKLMNLSYRSTLFCLVYLLSICLVVCDSIVILIKINHLKV